MKSVGLVLRSYVVDVKSTIKVQTLIHALDNIPSRKHAEV